MKKVIFTAVILSAILIGCKDNKENKIETSVETEAIHEHTEALSDHDHGVMALNNAWLDEIQLNEGKKWDANSETTQGVDKMAEIMKNNSANTVEEYHHLASELNDQKNFVVKECTMTGPSHDNLHVFLHPLIEKIDALSKVETVDNAEDITASIKENIEEYYNYFK